jgi:uncharacterized membrane protein
MARTASKADNPVTERLKAEARSLVGALGDRAVSSLGDKVNGTAGRLTKYVEGGAGPGLMAAFTGAKNLAEGKSPLRAMFGAGMAGVKEKVAGMFGRKGGGQKKLKMTNIVESIDVGVPVRVAYNQWTQFSDFPKFMKKVENVDQPDEQKTNWKAQVFWSHRTWEATIVDQVPDDRIIWRSKGQKGHVDGAVTFHELAPNLTRILLVMEYHPQGLFERTGNLWRAQSRRARLEFKHFRRHMMTDAVLHADEIEGWRGTIHDGQVVESHEDAMAKEGSAPNGSRRSGNGPGDGKKPRTGERPASRRSAEGRRSAETRSARSTSGRNEEPSGRNEEPSGRNEEPSGRNEEPSESNGERRRTRATAKRGGSK